MDDSQNSFSPDHRLRRSASRRTPAAVDPPSAELARPHRDAAPERLPRSDPVEPRRDDPSRRASVVVYCGDEEDVSRGFLIALSAMGVAVVETSIESAKPPVAR